MVEFKAVIADPHTGMCYQNTIAGHHANSLIGKKIGEKFPGSVAVKVRVSLPFQSAVGTPIVATRFASIDTVKSVAPA